MQNLILDPEFQILIPPLTEEEFTGLKQNILKNGCEDPLIVWKDQNILIDGHNRYHICQKYNVAFQVLYKEFQNRDEVKIYIINRQQDRRNIPDFVRFELADTKAEIPRKKGKEEQQKAGGDRRSLLSTIDKSDPKKAEERHNTQKEVAKNLGWSTGKTAMAQKVANQADEKTKQKLRQSKVSLNATYKQIRQKEKLAIQETKKQLRQQTATSIKNLSVTKQFKPEPTIQLDEWWQLGKHLLFCGDTSTPEFLSQLPGKISFAFADPPYNADAAEWDNNFNWVHDYLAEYANVVAVTPGIASIFNFAKITKMPYQWSLACWITNGMTRGAIGFGNWIYTALFSYGSIHHNAQDFIKVTIKTNETEETDHKGRKPAELLHYLVNLYSREQDIVLDPFLGSGQTLLVCEALKRRCIGGELEPMFCTQIIERWQAQTGLIAQRL